MMTSPAPMDEQSPQATDPKPGADRHALGEADVNALSDAEVAELFARAGGQPGLESQRLKEVTQVKAVLDLLMVALEKDSGLDARLQEQILAVSCDIEAKVAEALDDDGSGAAPDLSAVKKLLFQLVTVIERSRAAAAKESPKPTAEPVSLESEIMAEIAAANPEPAKADAAAWSIESLVDEVWSDPAKPAPAAEQPESKAEPATETADQRAAPQPQAKTSGDAAQDALYDSLKAGDPPLLEQTADGEIEVVASDLPPTNLPKCLTEPWDEKTKAKDGAKASPGVAARTTRALFGLFGRRSQKQPDPKAAEAKPEAKKAPAKKSAEKKAKKTKKSKSAKKS